MILKSWGLFQRHFCLPRIWGRVLTPVKPNSAGLVTFPDYTFPSTPFYVAPTLWNQWGPWALFDRLRGMPIPGSQFSGSGVKWESMGAKQKSPELQTKSEARVREQAKDMMSHGWGYRAKVRFQPKPIIVDKHWGEGYGARENAYSAVELERKEKNER